MIVGLNNSNRKVFFFRFRVLLSTFQAFLCSKHHHSGFALVEAGGVLLALLLRLLILNFAVANLVYRNIFYLLSQVLFSDASYSCYSKLTPLTPLNNGIQYNVESDNTSWLLFIQCCMQKTKVCHALRNELLIRLSPPLAWMLTHSHANFAS